LPAAPGPSDADFHRAYTRLLSLVGGRKRCLLRGERSPLSGAAETERAGTGPRQYVADGVGERDDRIVERCLHVYDPERNVLLFFLLETLLFRRFSRCFSHLFEPLCGRDYIFAVAFFLPATVARRGPLRVRAFVW